MPVASKVINCGPSNVTHSWKTAANMILSLQWLGLPGEITPLQKMRRQLEKHKGLTNGNFLSVG